MKFDCTDRSDQWRRWFAWYPVQVVLGDCRWLEIVERRKKPWPADYASRAALYGFDPVWQYRAIEGK